MILLSLFGIFSPKFLVWSSRYALLLIAVAAAIVTPKPGATVMLIFMAAIVALYFLGALVSYAFN